MTGSTNFTYASDTALIVVDMQHDFADPAGSLYVNEGEQIVEGVNTEIAAARAAGALVVYTQDWHPETTPHFAKDGGLWPVHCVADTPGADFVAGLTTGDHIIRKGLGPEDGYSGFTGLDLRRQRLEPTELGDWLEDAGIQRVQVIGLAGDWCVKATALDAVELGYPTTVPLALTRFVELNEGDTVKAVMAMRDAGVAVV